MTALGRPQFLVRLWFTQSSFIRKHRVKIRHLHELTRLLILPPGRLQLQFSEVLVKWRRFFSFLAAKQGKDGVEVLEQKLDLEQLQV